MFARYRLAAGKGKDFGGLADMFRASSCLLVGLAVA